MFFEDAAHKDHGCPGTVQFADLASIQVLNMQHLAVGMHGRIAHGTIGNSTLTVC